MTDTTASPHRLAEMSWTGLRDRLHAGKQSPIVLLPVGVIEEHGPHLPLGADSFVAEFVADETARRTGAIVAPVMNYGCSPTLIGFPGTIDLRSETLTRVLLEIMSELCRNGLRRIILVNNNGGNTAAGMAAAYELKRLHGVVVGNLYPWGLGHDLMRDQYANPTTAYGHGAEPEHSAMLAMFPHLVAPVGADTDATFVHPDGWHPSGHFAAHVPGHTTSSPVYWDFSSISPLGTSGDVALGSAELGRVWVDRVVSYCSDFVREYDANTRSAAWATGTDGGAAR